MYGRNFVFLLKGFLFLKICFHFFLRVRFFGFYTGE